MASRRLRLLALVAASTYVGRPETDRVRGSAMGQLSNGLYGVNQYAEALSVQEALLSLHQRLGAPNSNYLALQSNLGASYARLGDLEKALHMQRDVYFGRLRLDGQQHRYTILAANNYANALLNLKRFEEAKALLRKTIPVARGGLGENHEYTFRLRKVYAETLYEDADATLDDLRAAVNTLEEIERTARRVLGGGKPLTVDIEAALRRARATLGVREMPSNP